ncbi:MAG: hypothetical protein Q3988_04075 [Gemella sp.]|nr:hypothetical protein [Gemella sp.]
MIKRSIEFIIRVVVYGIFIYFLSEEFSRMTYTNMINSVSTLAILTVPFFMKFRSLEKQIRFYKEGKYLLPILNIMLAIFLIMHAYKLYFLGNNLIILVLGLFLIAILQTFDLVFLKKLKRELKV